MLTAKLIAYLSLMKKQTRLFWLVSAATIGWMLVMRPFTPGNIIEYEFARTVEKAIEIFMDWGAGGVEKAKMSILLDFVFLILYSWAISLGCKVVAGFAGSARVSKIGLQLSRLVWIAGACDLVENVSLLIAMHRLNNIVLELAFWTAGIKFAIILVALLFILVVTGIGLTKKILRPKEKDSTPS